MTIDERIQNTVKDLINKDPIPVNPLLMALKENIHVFHADFEFRNLFAIAKKNKKGVYFYPTISGDQRTQRFILAHLLGHYYLHFFQNKNGQFYRQYHYLSDAISKKESEADKFAYQLLMPDQVVRKLIIQNYSAKQMANVFQISSQKVNIRLNQITEGNL